MATDKFPNLRTGESRVLTFNFADDLEAGETLTGAADVVVTLMNGTDADPDTNIGYGTAVVGDTDVMLPVTPLVEDATYQIKVVCATTAAGKVLACAGTLKVTA